MRSNLLRWGWLVAWGAIVVACSSAGGADDGGNDGTGGTKIKGVTGGKAGTGGGGSDGEGGDAGSDSEGGSGGKGGKGGSSSGGKGGSSSGGKGGAAGMGSSNAFGGDGGSGGVNVAGQGGSSPVETCAAVAQKADAKTLPADLIWVIDTSGSMSEETASVQQKMNAFAGGILDVGVDVRVVLIAANFECPFGICDNPFFPPDGICLPAPLGSGQCPNDSKAPYYLHPNVEVGSTNALLKIKDSYPQWKSFLRPDSFKTIIVVTDDDGTSPPYDPASFPDGEKGSAKKFIQDFKALDPQVLEKSKVSGIFCFSNCPQAARPGKVWDALVTETGGIKGDLCKQDFQPVFNDIAQAVVTDAKLSCQWSIPAPPAGQQFDPTLVNVKFTSGGGDEEDILFAAKADQCDGQKGGWYYDNPSNPSAVVACPATCSKIQADNAGKIDVLFGCATRPVDIN